MAGIALCSGRSPPLIWEHTMDFSQFKMQYSISLDPQQEMAVQAADGPVLLLAVPGSGKTTVLVTRLGYLLRVRGIPPEHILTMTYTVAAAQDMRRRYASLFGEMEVNRLAFRTINGVCSRIIRYYERTLHRTAFSLLEDSGQKRALLGEIYYRQTHEFAGESTLKGLEAALTYAKNQMLKGKELEQVEAEGVDFPAFYQAYVQALRERQVMDYDDQMVYALQILRQYPQILQAIQGRYTHFCVDEAQDTSKIQHAILHLLAGQTRNLFLVGDEDQSIYGFRGADPQFLLQFDRLYPDARVLYLERNYRSTQPITAAADRFIQRNSARRPKQMRAVRGDGPPVRQISVYDRAEQYSYLCRLAEGCTTETAVLYRDNDSALPLLDLLNRAGIPYRCRQVEPLFFSNRVVRDITDIIRFAQNPRDGMLFGTLYYKLGAGISRSLAQEAVSAAQAGEEPILFYAAQHPSASPWTKRQCRALQPHLNNLLQERADRAIYRIVHFMGYGAYLENRGGDRSKADILEALGAKEPTPVRLLTRLTELQEVVRAGSSDPGCPFILSTIHSSKGLEYHRVILMDIADGLLPKVLNTPKEQTLYEEERRLFYVGMTRAKQELAVVTFRRNTLSSSFSQELFPKKDLRRSPLPPKAPSLPAPVQAAVQTQDYLPGSRLLHRSFGPGTLTGRTGDIATVTFDSGAVKKLSLSTALRSGQLCLSSHASSTS